jgi:hypothetical protein
MFSYGNLPASISTVTTPIEYRSDLMVRCPVDLASGAR